MAPLDKRSCQEGLFNPPLLTFRTPIEVQCGFEQHLQRVETWLKQVVNSIVGRNSVLKGMLLPVEEFKAGVALNRAPSKHVAWRSRNFAAIIPGDSVAEFLISNSVLNFLNLYNTVLIARLVLTWFPNAPEAVVNPLSTLCDPYLNVFRGIIPPLGTIDLSPILAFTVLDVFTSTAQALPCELGHKPQRKLGWREVVQHRKGLKGTDSRCA